MLDIELWRNRMIQCISDRNWQLKTVLVVCLDKLVIEWPMSWQNTLKEEQTICDIVIVPMKNWAEPLHQITDSEIFDGWQDVSKIFGSEC